MYIVSKFRDYYDTAIAYGIDKECIYNREEARHDIRNNLTGGWRDYKLTQTYSQSIQVKKNIYKFRQHWIGFCGEIYPCIEVEISYENNRELTDELFFYNIQEYTEFMDEHKLWNKSYSFRLENDRYSYTKKGAEKFFNKDTYKFLKGFFVEVKAPVFEFFPGNSRRNFAHTILTNTNLSKYKFFKVKDAYTAFQDIYMYKAGVLGNTEVDTVTVNDKVKAQQKGFDNKSFKTMKGDKKPRAKNRGKNK